jgi:hypothetical protein
MLILVVWLVWRVCLCGVSVTTGGVVTGVVVTGGGVVGFAALPEGGRLLDSKE